MQWARLGAWAGQQGPVCERGHYLLHGIPKGPPATHPLGPWQGRAGQGHACELGHYLLHRVLQLLRRHSRAASAHSAAMAPGLQLSR